MKKAFILFILCAVQCFSQDADTLLRVEENMKFDFYQMQNEYIIHYFAEIKGDTLMNDISLRNGSTITSKAELVNKNGKIIFLINGQCVDSKGNIADCKELRKRLEERTKD